MPRVSIVIPTYNRATLIAEALHSVQAQTFQDFEIIVADDGSTDNTAQVVQQFGQSLIYVSLPHRGQPAATRNGGLRAATGEFIAFLDSDDIYFEYKLSTQIAVFDAYPEVGVVYSDGVFFRDTPDQPIGHIQTGLPSPSGNVFAELLRGNFLAPPVMLIRKTCLDRVGWFDEHPDYVLVEDYDLWLRLATQCPFKYVPGDVAAIRRHPGNSSSNIATLRRRTLLVLAKMDILFPDSMNKYRNARHAGYARNHGAVARAELRQKHLASGFSHGLGALYHTLQLPSLGLPEFTDWWKRRRLRQNIHSDSTAPVAEELTLRDREP
jgi:glycosyltransferase involved in cell wall biosynthesis